MLWPKPHRVRFFKLQHILVTRFERASVQLRSPLCSNDAVFRTKATIRNLEIYGADQLGEFEADRALGNLQRLGCEWRKSLPRMDTAISSTFPVRVALPQPLNQVFVGCWHLCVACNPTTG